MASNTVQQIKERLSILDVVAPYVELHKAGKSYKGKSPFTNEKTPSFFVSPDRGMYYCFSTSQGGDIFTFVQTVEGVDFKGALKLLADKAGVELVPEDPQKRTERDTQYSIIEEAARFFEHNLTHTNTAQTYLIDRGVKKDVIAAWRIGYAPGPPERGWRELRDHLQKKNHTDDQLLKVGLVKSVGEGKAPYDVFRDRVMFPICDSSGRVVAFSGRILSKDSDAPKYVNSPETELFNKSEILFGYDKAKQGIRHYDFSLIVEGQFDVVLSHQAGYTNAVAVSGTALTPHHVALLQRLSDRVVLALDADRAGVAAVRRAADLMLARGMDVKVARLPSGEDPADIIKKDAKKFRAYIGASMHVIEFLLKVVREEVKSDRTFKLRVRNEVVPYLLKIESRIDREHFEAVIANAIDSTIDAIRLEVARLEQYSTTQSVQQPMVNNLQEAKGELLPERKQNLIDYFAVLGELIEGKDRVTLDEQFSSITETDLASARAILSPELASPLTFQLEREIESMSEHHLHVEIAARLQELRVLVIRAKMRELREQLLEAEQLGEEDRAENILGQLAVLQKKLGATPLDADLFAPKKLS